MIRVHRPVNAPEVLLVSGVEERDRLCAEFDKSPQDYLSGAKTFASGDFKSGVYGAKSVKQALIAAQHGKCAFCESKVTAIAYGDVEHFRPKAGFQQQADDSLGRPGYYWLAYEWTNLLFSCQLCNQQRKKNLFPLRDPDRRARSHYDDPAAEKPLLIDPAAEDPEACIGFRAEVAFPRRGNVRGKTTIDVLGLNRDALCEERRTWLATLRILDGQRTSLRRLIQAAGPNRPADLATQLADIDAHFDRLRQDASKYAGMVRANFP